MDNVLVVDPDGLFLKVAREVLHRAGMDVSATESGWAAREHLEAGCAVLVLSCDLQDVPPRALILQAFDANPDMECIALTNMRDDPLVAQLHEEQLLYNHLTKPLEDIRDLARQVGRALERRALRRQKGHLLAELRDARDALRTQTEFFVQVERLALAGQLAADLLPAAAASLEYEARILRNDIYPAANSPGPEAGNARPQGAADTLERAAHRLAHILHLVTNSGTNRAPVSLMEAVGWVVRLFESWAQARGVSLVLEPVPPLPDDSAPALEAAQALAHLLMNACRAARDGGRVAISLAADGGRNAVKIRVKDTGPGIPQELRRHLFQPFFTTRPFGEGTGLGLYAARELLRRYGGDLRLESSSPAGTTFEMLIPLARRELASRSSDRCSVAP